MYTYVYYIYFLDCAKNTFGISDLYNYRATHSTSLQLNSVSNSKQNLMET